MQQGFMVGPSLRRRSEPHGILSEKTFTESRRARGVITGITGLKGEKELLLTEKFNTVS